MPKFKALKSDAGQRADILVARKLPKFSRSSLQGLFDRGLAKLGGKPIKAGEKLHAGDVIEIDTSLLTTTPEAIDMPVIYEDSEVIVLNKPAGVLTHSKGALNLEATVASFIKPKVDKTVTGNRAGIVHRLDRGTSGLIITAKNEAALKYLQKQFSQRKVNKTYLAIVEGSLKPQLATIDAPIGRNPQRPQTFKVMASGRPAKTDYKVIETNDRTSLVELAPMTGRTHQIRIHMAYIGHPIVGDHIYGRGKGMIKLHAWKLKLRLPTGELKEFEVEPPREFKL